MPAGRPRAFDTEKALDAALKLFWQKGYEGTSLPDLTDAMGINRPSLYAAFGNKEELFRKVLDRYGEKCTAAQEAFAEPTARKVVEHFLLGLANRHGTTDNPPGCLMISGAMACGEGAEAIREELVARRAAGEALLRERLKRAVAEGDFSGGRDPEGLARYVSTVAQGMAVQGTSGATRAQLLEVAKLALKSLPE